MDALTIRPATAADVAALSDLIRRTVRLSNAGDYAAPVVELISANHAPDKVAQRLVERDVFVCLDGPRIVGTIGLGGDKRTAWLPADPVRRARRRVDLPHVEDAYGLLTVR